jgi:hypothetical protein
MQADNRELWVIVGAMIFFLIICVTAVALFVRQWRRERGGGARKPPDQEQR